MHYGEKFERALVYAARLHRDQRRKGTGIPYITHLLAVSAIVGESGGTEDEVVAALLHDAVEDQGGAETREEIRLRFGENVAAIVDGCSDTDIIPKPPWRERKRAYIERIRSAPHSVRIVSAADKLHNARSVLADYRAMGESLWTRFTGGREGTLWFYRAFARACGNRGSQRIIEELDRVVGELEHLAGTPRR